ncbi:hypothetical protein [Streptomyces sp. MZ04]|uniref:hypothetical protein n=1 Tax=Streptomyces sp. MZ04 TaxID=2559236 RepID=UPI00107E9380|nr:hypothetical protein [Streptomyces sp. MZ04]TGB11373.1 hypothetical protein E2651_13365 [Streptomyces sp. MZ04]
MTAPHQREARAGFDVRLLRAAVFAVLCVVLSAGGHLLASCASVPLWTLGAGFLAVLAVAAPLAGRERSLPGIAAALAAGQVGLHALFAVGQHGGTVPQSADASLVERAARIVCGAGAATLSPAEAQRILATAGVQGTGHSMHHGTGAMAADTAMGSMSPLPSLPMLLAHVLAAVAAGWLLRRGDVALLRLVRLSADGAQGVAEGALVRSLRGALALVRALRAGLPGAPETGPLTPRTGHLVPPKPHTTALQHTVIRRGPPTAAALVLAA